MASSIMAQQTGNTSGLAYYATNQMMQTFTVPASGYDTLQFFNLIMRKTGTPSGNLIMSVYRTSGGLPTGSAIGSFTKTSGDFGTSYDYETFDFTPDVTISANEKLAIVFTQTSVTGTANAVYWGHDNGSTYSGGNSYYSTNSGVSWNLLSGDFAFQAFGDTVGSPPTGVTTGAVSSITTTTADVAINVTSDGGTTITERGVAYSSTNATPVTGDNKKTTTGTTGAGTVSLTALSPGIFYYVRAYATNSVGTTYGDVVSFTTLSTTPLVSSVSASSIGSINAILTGNVTSDGGATVTERGVCWGTSANPTTASSKATNGTGTGEYSVSATGLTAGTLYHYRAYAINTNGTVYGSDLTFTTLNAVKYWAQSFTAGVTGTLTSVQLQAKLVSGTNGKLKVRIYSTNAGSPNALLSSASDIIINDSSYTTITIPTNQAIVNTTVYWIVIEDIKTVDYSIWLGSNSAGGYANGAIKYTLTSAPTTWINTSHTTDDMYFVTNSEAGITATFNVEVKAKKYYR